MPSRRSLRWFSTFADAQTVTAGGQSNNSLLSLVDSADMKGATITRMIVQLVLASGAADQIGRVKWGIVVVSEDAAVAAAFPEADFASDQADWLVRGAELVRQSDVDDGSQHVRVFRDLRAQRVIRSADDQLHFIIDKDSTTGTVNYDLFTRVLLRMP